MTEEESQQRISELENKLKDLTKILVDTRESMAKMKGEANTWESAFALVVEKMVDAI